MGKEEFQFPHWGCPLHLTVVIVFWLSFDNNDDDDDSDGKSNEDDKDDNGDGSERDENLWSKGRQSPSPHVNSSTLQLKCL